MKRLVVYYSRSGTTATVAASVAKFLHADIEEVKDTKNRKGWIGYFFAGRDGWEKRLTQIAPISRDPSRYDLVIIGTPIWVNLTPAIRTYLTDNGNKIKKCAFFCTMGGSGGGPAFAEMESLCGKKPVGILELVSADFKDNSSKGKVRKFINKLLKLTR
jgi:flavodoxin